MANLPLWVVVVGSFVASSAFWLGLLLYASALVDRREFERKRAEQEAFQRQLWAEVGHE